MTGEKLSSIEIPNMELAYWAIRASSRRGGDWVKGEIIILVPLEFHFITEHEDPINNIILNVLGNVLFSINIAIFLILLFLKTKVSLFANLVGAL